MSTNWIVKIQDKRWVDDDGHIIDSINNQFDTGKSYHCFNNYIDLNNGNICYYSTSIKDAKKYFK